MPLLMGMILIEHKMEVNALIAGKPLRDAGGIGAA
jgi:hypothetical protein